ncbi:putative bifunctional diguanylate cyclase/phosphodiesterase [Aureimonas populi]|uniref:Bifunctional diguanylate cyclase/phosphodiesterase n=1 Tax=Aureimonas populi TaxID=1701758 RepID=A0ABW5CJX5_9HYPH|nr:EAL domain-containing protein [Aureimonas populi]
MSINAKLLFGGLLLAAIAVGSFVQSQLVQSGASQIGARIFTWGVEPLSALQAAQARTEALTLRLAEAQDMPGAGSRPFTAEFNDILLRLGNLAPAVPPGSAVIGTMEEIRVILSRLKAAQGDVSARLMRRELAAAGALFDTAVADMQNEIVELRNRSNAGYAQAFQIQASGLAGLLLMGLLVAAYLSSSVARPVRAAAQAVRSIESDPSAPIEERGLGPFTELFGALVSLQSRLRERQAEREKGFAAGTAALKEEVDKLKRRFEAAIGNMPQGFCMLDEKRNLVAANDSFRRIFSYLGTQVTAKELQADPELEPLFSGQGGEVVVRETPDGQVIEVRRMGLDGRGAIITVENVTEQREARRRIEELAGRDALTQLPNRIRFHDHLNAALRRENQKSDIGVLCLDIDGFRGINSTYGNAVGDAVLREVAARLEACIGDRGYLARIGADDFAIVQKGLPQPAGCEALAADIRQACRPPISVEGSTLPASLSIGMVQIKARGQRVPLDPYTVMQDAELALAHAQRQGLGSVCLFASAMRQEMDQRRQLEADLRAAIGSDQLELFYQPFIDVTRGRVSGFEALMRWRHPVRGMVPPGTFIPLAEEVGLIDELGVWALREACRQATGWPGDLTLSVNLSPVQFRSASLIDDIRTALKMAGLAPQRLQLEVTESLFLDNDEGTLATLRALRALGLTISMDDFGTGYSSLGYLSRFPFDKIKIDQSFVRAMDKAENAAIVRAVIGLSSAMNMSVIAEGVETPEQFERLCQEGCREMQGYLFSRPRPAADLARLILRINSAFAQGEFAQGAPAARQRA